MHVNEFLYQDYSAEDMNENQLRFLQHLREFGLVYQRKVRLSNVQYVCSEEKKEIPYIL